MATARALYLGSTRKLGGAGAASDLQLPAHHLVTHGVVVGMIGSAKTGLTTVITTLRCARLVPPPSRGVAQAMKPVPC